MRHRHALWSAIALVVIVLASWAMRLPRGAGADALNLDVNLYFYPTYEAAYERLATGVLPTWNPYQLCGIPWLATLQGGFFYPLHVLYLLLPLHLALAGSHLVHLPLAALSMASFARRAGLTTAAALLAAMLFTLRGMFALSLAAPNYVEAVAWLPLGALAVLELGKRRPVGGVALLATSAAASFLAGYPQPTTYMLYTWATLAVAMLVAERASPRRFLAIGALFGGALALGVLAAAVQLFPALELVREGAHRNLSPEAMALGLSPAASILASSAIAGGAFSWGATALALGAAALLHRRLRVLASWAILMTVITVVVSLGDRTPIFSLYRALPLLGSFRFPDRALGMTDFAFALVAALGLDAVVATPRGAAPTRRRAASLVSLAALAVIVVLVHFWGAPATQRTPIVASALASGALLLGGVVSRGPSARILATGFIVVAGAEMLLAPWRQLVTYSASTVPRYAAFASEYRAVAARAGSDRAWFSSGLASLQPERAVKLATRYGVRTIDDYEPLTPRRQAEYFTYFGEGTLTYHRAPWLFAGGLATLAPPPGVEPPATRRRLLDLAAVRFVLVPAGSLKVRPDIEAFIRDAGLEPRRLTGRAFDLFENPRALPRAFVVYRTRPAPEPEALLAMISRPDFDPLVETYVEGAPVLDSTPETLPRGAPARIVVDDERVVEIDATLARPGLVVLADACYPGWQATVDGAPASISCANYLFRGIPTPEGTHRIALEYRPTSVRVGAIGSVFGWLTIVALALGAKKRPPRSERRAKHHDGRGEDDSPAPS